MRCLKSGKWRILARISQVALVVKNLGVNAGDLRDTGSIPRWGRSPGRGHGSPVQYSCLENLMDRGDWQARVHRVAKSQATRLKQLTHTDILANYLKTDTEHRKTDVRSYCQGSQSFNHLDQEFLTKLYQHFGMSWSTKLCVNSIEWNSEIVYLKKYLKVQFKVFIITLYCHMSSLASHLAEW